MYKNIWETEWNFTFFLKKERNCFTFPSLEHTYASVFTLTELSGLDWGAVHLDIPKAHFECSPRRTKPARRWRRRNPGDFGRSQWAQVWNRTKDGGETKVSILYSSLLPGSLHLRQGAGMWGGSCVQRTGLQPEKAGLFTPVMISIQTP